MRRGNPKIRQVEVRTSDALLGGELAVPETAHGLVVFVHGSGSSRHSPRNQFVARSLQECGLATLLFDLLTEKEEQEEVYTRHLRFDVGMLARRLLDATEWLRDQEEAQGVPIGYFGSSTGAAAGLIAAAELGKEIAAVVSRGGRPDLAADHLRKVKAPTLLIVGGRDFAVIDLNEAAFEQLQCEKLLRILPGATHLFEEPGALQQAAQLAGEWFGHYLPSSGPRSSSVGVPSTVGAR
jgi:putative phosphoribosyl transferase